MVFLNTKDTETKNETHKLDKDVADRNEESSELSPRSVTDVDTLLNENDIGNHGCTVQKSKVTFDENGSNHKTGGTGQPVTMLQLSGSTPGGRRKGLLQAHSSIASLSSVRTHSAHRTHAYSALNDT